MLDLDLELHLSKSYEISCKDCKHVVINGNRYDPLLDCNHPEFQMYTTLGSIVDHTKTVSYNSRCTDCRSDERMCGKNASRYSEKFSARITNFF